MTTHEERAYIEGQIAGIKTAKAALERGPAWHLRDWIARSLHWLAIRIEPKE